MSRATTVLMLVAILFLMPVVAQATMIENLTTSNTIFYDNFEGVTAGTSPAASVGSWSIGSLGTGNSITVEDFNSTGISAYEGDQFLKLHSVGSKFSLAKAVATTGSSNNGDVITMELAHMITEGPSSGIYFENSEGMDFALTITGPSPLSGLPVANGVYNYYGGAWNLVPGVTVTPSAWNTISITHTNGVADCSVTINGTTFTGKTCGDSTKSWTTAWFGPNAGATTTTYIDAIPVPEPTTSALLATGLIGLLAFAWKKRK